MMRKNSSTSSAGTGGAGAGGNSVGTNAGGSGVGSDVWVYQELGEPTLCMHSEITSTQQQQQQHNHSTNGSRRILLRTRILLRDAYQRQGDNIITWCEPYLEEGNPTQGVDLALSFQDNSGCLDIWRQITHVQQRANEMFLSARRSGGAAGRNNTGSSGENNNSNSNNFGGGSGGSGGGTHSVADMAQAVAAAHHADLQRQDQQEMWVNVASEAAAQHNHYHQQQHHGHHHNMSSHHHSQGGNDDSMMDGNDHDRFEDSVGNMVPSYHDSNSPGGTTSNLPNPPSLSNLEEIADTIAAVQVRDSFLACYLIVCYFNRVFQFTLYSCIDPFVAHSTKRIACHIHITERLFLLEVTSLTLSVRRGPWRLWFTCNPSGMCKDHSPFK